MMAESSTTTTDCGAAIGRLRQIAAESGDHLLLGDAPPHPDAKLLDICAEIGEQAKRLGRPEWHGRVPWPGERERPEYDRRMAARQQEIRRLGFLLRQAGKLRATTGAGIYAKALAVRHSQTGARLLCISLADDLLANPALRASLWAADPGRQAQREGGP